MANRLKLVWLVLSTLAGGVLAQTPNNDPTRPPAGMTAGTPEAVALTGPVLQSVMIPKKGKPVAVISGQQVRLGQAYGDSHLVKLTEREAVLDGPGGIERLLLTPGIEKTNITTKTSIKTTPAAKRVQSGGMP
ncbi:hypothetical protein [Propionivibrio sp.]|uniref:hypothetical protein n=1 Tax=Propionivibrio sp. TaxID=2212460 RepID=UPI002624E196|nr:hypothetical protein [Propionivibrio sp.]